MQPSLPLLLLLTCVTVAHSASARQYGPRFDWDTRQMELEMEQGIFIGQEDWGTDMGGLQSSCFSFDDCNVTCTLSHLEVFEFWSSNYSCQGPDTLIVTVEAYSDDAVLRLRLNDASNLAVNESLTVLENGDVTLAVLTESQETWVASQFPTLALEYQMGNDSDGQIQLTMVAYNQTQEDQVFTTEMTGVLEAAEQAQWTGSADYAVNTERYWHLNLLEAASQINFTVTDLDLDPAAGDLLIIGSGRGPYDTEPAAELLTGRFPRRQYHVPGGEAFVYFLSRSHGKPRAPFQVSYVAEPIVGPTTTMPTTTDRDHPPTPADADFQLPCFATGIDPHRFLDPNDTATANLQAELAIWANVYRTEHSIPTWRSVHQDDIQFSAWMMCDSTSGWAKHDPVGCVRVTWYIELLRDDGNWGFLEPDLRGIIEENGESINDDLGYKFSLTLDEVNKTWWWAIAIALVPLALLAFLVVMWMSSSASKNKSDNDENASLADLDELEDEHQNNIDKERKTINDEKDQQMKKLFSDDDIPEYDPELQGAHRHRDLHTRFSQLPPAPLKSALKKTPAAYTNAAFEGDGGGAPQSSTATPATVPAPAPAPAAATLPAEPASSELTEQLRLLNELNKTLKEEQKQAPGLELPRVDRLVTPAAAPESKMFSMNEDGTGVEVDAAHPGHNILQLDDGGGSEGSDDRKTSSV